MGDKIKLGLQKQDRLSNVKLIDQVFKSSHSIKAFPLIFSYNYHEDKSLPFQILFSVPKRKFGRAVDRNRIKRLIKECFRHKRPDFVAALKDQSAYGAIIYTNKEMPDFQTIEKSVNKILSKLNESAGN